MYKAEEVIMFLKIRNFVVGRNKQEAIIGMGSFEKLCNVTRNRNQKVKLNHTVITELLNFNLIFREKFVFNLLKYNQHSIGP